jgi:hypothetical protein
MPYAKRVDENHSQIRDEFRRLLGKENVVDTSAAGNGLGDLIITYGGLVMLIEIKTAKGKLTKAQKACKLPQRLVRNVADVADSVAVLKKWCNQLSGNRLDRITLLGLDDYPDNRVRWAKT